MEWYEAIEVIRPYVFHISTQNGTGTGWLVSLSKSTNLCAVATAGHVLAYAHYWELPIRISHTESGQSLLLRATDRAINLDPNQDTAALTFGKADLGLPTDVLPILDADSYLKPGVEIGWIGFPAIPDSGLCFFSGRISSYVQNYQRYLVDGVAINGVSGGPAFSCVSGAAQVMGVVSAYMANRVTGEALPGVAVVQGVRQFHDIAGRFKSIDEARSQQSPPTQGPGEQSPGRPPQDTETRGI